MLAALKKAMGAHSLLSVYPSVGMDTFYVGYVCEVNERTILMKLITTKGYESGFSVFFTDNIQKVTMDGCYERKIQRLLRNNGISFDALKRMPTTGSPVEDLLSYARDGQKLLSVRTDFGETLLCRRVVFLKDCFYAEVYDEYGCENGCVYLNTDRVCALSVESDEETLVQMLLSDATDERRQKR